MDEPHPTGSCWCGCGAETSPTAFFVSGHDKIAEAAVVKAEYGSVAAFLMRHGYVPGRKSPKRPRLGNGSPTRVEVKYGGEVGYYDRDVFLPVPRLIVYRDGKYWCPVDVLLSGPAHELAVVPSISDSVTTSDMHNHLARFAAREIKAMVYAGELPHEQTDRVQRIGIHYDVKPAQGVNRVVSVDSLLDYFKSASDGVQANEREVLGSFDVD